jgi:hypothetical protein
MKADYHTAAALTSTRARQIRRSLPSERCSRDEQPAISTVYEMIFRARSVDPGFHPLLVRAPSPSCPARVAKPRRIKGGTRPDAQWAKTAASMIQ